MDKKRVAMVVQRYGEEVNGGAEMLARWLAEHLTGLAEMHVITTCAVDHHTWADVYPPGDSELNGVIIHRFPVDGLRTDRYQNELFTGARSVFTQLQWMREQGPYSTGLLNYVYDSYDSIDLYIFVTYLYPPVFFGLPLVSDKAILIPNAHDEPYLHLPIFRSLFHLPQAIVYNTVPEKLLVNRVMHNNHVPQIVAGVGVNVPNDVSAARFRQKFGIEGPFILYVGRVEESKNVPELIDQFIRYREETGRDLKLVLVGKVKLHIPNRPDIVPLGFVTEEDKFDAVSAAEILVMPSLFESLSIVAMEAWLMETPTLLNGRCEVLEYQSRQSNGGLYYYSYEEFAMALTMLLDDEALRHRLGSQGRAFVTANYSWPVILAKYRAIIDTLTRTANDEQDHA
ncbi:MAG: glycosyltransferase [Anaerolineae bacterium]|nr:glycosyltransferase [Anaerolineae bacterium]